MTIAERCIDWLINVWDELGEETTKADIVQDFTNILGEKSIAEEFVEAWFKDHSKVLQVQTDTQPSYMKLIAYEGAVKAWVEKQLR